MKLIYVLGSGSNANWLKFLYPNTCSLSCGELPYSGMVKPDLILFTGGQDINPQLYGESYPEIHFTSYRDNWEVEWFNWAVDNKIPMFGICRGMQLFTALTGGKLIPHVEGHYGNHSVFTNRRKFKEFKVNSIHHQMCIPGEGILLLAWAENVAYKDKVEPEALWFPTVRALGVQWHPEMMHINSIATQFVLTQVKEYFL